jgi:hypothetical protein
MLKTISPALKGLITSVLMIGIVMAIYNAGDDVNPSLQYLIYVVYAGGIIWTLLAHRRSPNYTGSFGNLFSAGFRCFIIVTLVMVLFTAIFSKMHPSFAEDSAKAYKEQLIAEKNKTPEEIDRETEQYKKQYTIRLVSVSIFGYLIIGAGITAFGSVLLTRRK